MDRNRGRKLKMTWCCYFWSGISLLHGMSVQQATTKQISFVFITKPHHPRNSHTFLHWTMDDFQHCALGVLLNQSGNSRQHEHEHQQLGECLSCCRKWRMKRKSPWTRTNLNWAITILMLLIFGKWISGDQERWGLSAGKFIKEEQQEINKHSIRVVQ